MLGSLLFKKLCFGATVGPAFELLLATPAGLRAQLWYYKKVLCKPDDYTVTKALDTQMASIVMLLEIPLAVGLCVPVLVPLACVCCAAHAAAFQCSSLPLKYNSKPSARYLWASLGLGCALVAWLFYEASLHGYWLVILGPPPIAMCTALAVRSRCREWWLQQARGMKMFEEHSAARRRVVEGSRELRVQLHGLNTEHTVQTWGLETAAELLARVGLELGVPEWQKLQLAFADEPLESDVTMEQAGVANVSDIFLLVVECEVKAKPCFV